MKEMEKAAMVLSAGKEKGMKRIRSVLDITLCICITMLLITLPLGGVILAMVETRGVELVRQSNLQMLQEVGYHLSYVDRSAVSFCQMYYNDSEVQSLLAGLGKDDAFVSAQVLRRINRTLVSYEMVESVLLYSGTTGKNYGTSSSLSTSRNEMVQHLQDNQRSEVAWVMLRPVYNDVTRQYDHNVLSYVLAERELETGRILSAVVVDVSTDWLLNNLSQKFEEDAGWVLLENTGCVLLDTRLDGVMSPELSDKMLQSVGGSFVEKIDGQRALYTCVTVPQAGWVLVAVQPFSAVQTFARNLRNGLLMAFLLALLFGVPLALLMARRIHRPVELLYRSIAEKFPGNSKPEHSGRDVEELLAIFEVQHDRLQELELYRESSEAQLQRGRLKNVLQASAPVEHMRKTLLPAVPGGRVLVVLLKIANFSGLSAGDANEKSLMRFAVANVAEELLQPFGVVQIVPMSEGRLAVLLWPASKQQDLGDIRAALHTVIEKLYELLQLSVSAFLDWSENAAEPLGRCYRNLTGLAEYTLLFGSRCLLSAEELAERDRRAPEYPLACEQELLEKLDAADADGAAVTLGRFLEQIGKDNAAGFRACSVKLVIALQTYVGRRNEHKFARIEADFTALLNQVQKAETLQQIERAINSMLACIAQQMPYNAQQKNHAVVNSVKAYIDENYADKAICGKMLGVKMNVSGGYLNQLFKEQLGCSVQEYINQVRLDHAQEQILQTTRPIAQIVESCGLETSSFYRLYKMRYGVSPKEQRARKCLEDVTK